MDNIARIDSLCTFIHHKKNHKFCFVGSKCQKCRDLCAFLGVKSGLLILVRVKDLTFSNSDSNEDFPLGPAWMMPFSIVEWVLHNKYSKMGVNKKVEI